VRVLHAERAGSEEPALLYGTEKAWRSVSKNSRLALDTIILKYLVAIPYKIGYYVPEIRACGPVIL
jgi:hypothetical protein